MGINDFIKVGEKIKKARINAGYKQKDFAAKLGIPVSTLANYEANKREPKSEMLIKIAEALQCSPLELLDDSATQFEKLDVIYSNMKEKVHTLEQIQRWYGEEYAELMGKYESLNDLGKAETLNYINYLSEQEKYRKE